MNAVDHAKMASLGVTIHFDDPKDPEAQMQMGEETHGCFAVVDYSGSSVGRVVNTIVIDSADEEAVQHFVNLHEELVLIQNPGAGSPGIGWRQAGRGTPLVPPPLCLSDDDGKNSPVTFTYTDELAPSSVVVAEAAGHRQEVQLDAQGVGTVKLIRPLEGDDPVLLIINGVPAPLLKPPLPAGSTPPSPFHNG